MTLTGMGLVLYAAAAIEIEDEEKKREEKTIRRLQVKRRKKCRIG